MMAKLRLFLIIGLFLIVSISASSGEEKETLTITTYYPAPYGVYKDLDVKENVIVGDISPSSEKEGELWVKEGVVFKSLDSLPECNSNLKGKMIYYNDKFRYCDGSNWEEVGGPPTLQYVDIGVNTVVRIDLTTTWSSIDLDFNSIITKKGFDPKKVHALGLYFYRICESSDCLSSPAFDANIYQDGTHVFHHLSLTHPERGAAWVKRFFFQSTSSYTFEKSGSCDGAELWLKGIWKEQ